MKFLSQIQLCRESSKERTLNLEFARPLPSCSSRGVLWIQNNICEVTQAESIGDLGLHRRYLFVHFIRAERSADHGVQRDIRYGLDDFSFGQAGEPKRSATHRSASY